MVSDLFVQDVDMAETKTREIVRGGSRVSGQGVHMYKIVGFALLILSHFSSISHENEIIWSH